MRQFANASQARTCLSANKDGLASRSDGIITLKKSCIRTIHKAEIQL